MREGFGSIEGYPGSLPDLGLLSFGVLAPHPPPPSPMICNSGMIEMSNVASGSGSIPDDVERMIKELKLQEDDLDNVVLE